MSVNLAFDDVSGAASPICSKAFITPPPRDREKRQPGGKQFVPKAVELITGNASVNETIRRFREALTKHWGFSFPSPTRGSQNNRIQHLCSRSWCRRPFHDVLR
ncbi:MULTISPECIES: hypothetical protein [unclassified Bradyrhizobium]|uniref:hypothetical protein n=1 Tax=unclassified Bradyrhizobium TaxID=2631580 RepID=UPI00339B8229